jgi:O-antigen ligase
MRQIAWISLLLFVVTIPWEYSLVLPAPFGNVARIAGLLTLASAIFALIQEGRLRTPVCLHWMVLALYLWWCCTAFWTINTPTTEAKLRGYVQEMMIIWLLWEFVESATGLRTLLRVWVAGCWVLALLTLADFAAVGTMAGGQIRFVAAGQDANDVARFLDLGLPLAAMLFRCEERWLARILGIAFLPVGLMAVLLTASRSGFVAALVALAGCAIVLGRGRAKTAAAGILALPAAASGLWLVIPRGTLERLATIPAELETGDLNQRLNIWSAGWSAFVRAPVFGTGAGTFVSAAGTAPLDTAHSTLLSVAVTGGLCAVFLAAGVLVVSAWSVANLHGALRITLATALTLWMLSSLVATVEESRTTWLLLGVIAVAARLASENPDENDRCFERSSVGAQMRHDPGWAVAPQ